MLFTPKEITLRDGRTAILRTPEVSEAARLLEVLIRVSGETEFLSQYPEERAKMTLEDEERWVRSAREDEDHLVITCQVDGLAVGNCGLQFHTTLMTRHRATIGISILQAYWGLGIGSAFFREMIAAAEARPGLELLELQVLEDNHRARRLYEKFGFREVAAVPMAYKTRDGRYRTCIHMQKQLHK